MFDITEHVAIVMTAWATIAAALAAFIAAFVAQRSLSEAHRAAESAIQQAKVVAAYQLINQLDERWNSQAMRDRRREVAKDLLPGRPLPGHDGLDDIIDLFETMALCVNDQVIPLKLASHFFGYWAINYWFAATARINHVRASNPIIWEDLAAFMPKLLDYQAQHRQRAVAEITPTSEQLQKFLQEEING